MPSVCPHLTTVWVASEVYNPQLFYYPITKEPFMAQCAVQHICSFLCHQYTSSYVYVVELVHFVIR